MDKTIKMGTKKKKDTFSNKVVFIKPLYLFYKDENHGNYT